MDVQYSIAQLFEQSRGIKQHLDLLKLLKKKFRKTTWKEFSTVFIKVTMSVINSQATIHDKCVNNKIKFAANGISMLSEHMTKDHYTGLLLISKIFKLTYETNSNAQKAIKWRFCLFYKHMLKSMKVLSKELCGVTTVLLLNLLQDKNSPVRTQAAHALHETNPNNPQSYVVQQLIFRMTCDPSAKVRAAVVEEIGMFNSVIDKMLKTSLRDVSDDVRIKAYNRFLNHPFLWLTSKQRQTVLEYGLVDTNNNVKSIVENQLLKRWLEKCNNDFVLFLNKLGVMNEVVCEKSLSIIFENYYYDSEILDLINKYLNSDSRTIVFKELTVEKLFLWKCVAKYLKTMENKRKLVYYQGHVEYSYVNTLLPDLISFSNYIRNYNSKFKSTDSYEFILTQLLDMTSTFSIDHVGAKHINKLCLDLILDDQISVKIVKSLALLLDLTLKNGPDLLSYVKKILNEIQSRIVDVYPLINKVGTKEFLEHRAYSKTVKIEKLLKNEPSKVDQIKLLEVEVKEYQKQYDEIKVLPKEKILGNRAVVYVLKALELIYQVQQLPKVVTKLSLLTSILENFVVVYLDCSMVNLRMEAIRCLTPISLSNNVSAAKSLLKTLCDEIKKPLTDKLLLFQTMFELFKVHDLKTFNIPYDDLDTEDIYEDKKKKNDILVFICTFINYDLDDSCNYKLVIVKGFCDLLIHSKVKSTKLLTQLFIVWVRCLSRETLNIYDDLTKFFTSYVLTIDTSSHELAKCYVPLLKEMHEHNLVQRLDISLDEVNSILIKITRGLMFQKKKRAINAHDELACYILDYLLDEDQPYTTMLVHTLYKLEIDFDNINKLVSIIGPKLLCVINHLKKLDKYKDSIKLLKNIKNKFLQKIKPPIKENNEMQVDVIKPDNVETQVPSISYQEPDLIEIFNDQNVTLVSENHNKEKHPKNKLPINDVNKNQQIIDENIIVIDDDDDIDKNVIEKKDEKKNDSSILNEIIVIDDDDDIEEHIIEEKDV